MNDFYIVELEPDTLWIAPWEGDPGRTCIKDNAKKYKSIVSAACALKRAKEYRNFDKGLIIKHENI